MKVNTSSAPKASCDVVLLQGPKLSRQLGWPGIIRQWMDAYAT